MDRVTSFFEMVAGGIRLADLADITVVSALVYLLIAWFRAARSRFVVLGIAAFLGLYFVARALSMHVTLLIFQALVTVALVAVVVIFQEEIRRTFERVATGGSLRARVGKDRACRAWVKGVVAAVRKMAADKTGALLVFRGREPLTRHVTGGHALDGQPSAALLFSIFDHHSEGHDGAVIIEDGRITRFGAHLPLSRRAGDRPSGLRHTAALGMSEHSDALLVVVSEERGVITVGEGGELAEVSGEQLESRVLAYLRRLRPRPPRAGVERLIFGNLGPKLLSVTLAIVAWAVLFAERTEVVTRNLSAQVEYRSVPSDWVVDEPNPASVTLTLYGTREAFDRLGDERPKIMLDVGGVANGAQVIPIADADVHRPDGLELRSISPREVTVTATATVAVELAVNPHTSGRVATGFGVVRVRAEPKRIRIIVPKNQVGRLRQVSTERVSLDGLTESVQHTVGLVLPEQARLPAEASAQVQVFVDIAPLRRPSPTPSAAPPTTPSAAVDALMAD